MLSPLLCLVFRVQFLNIVGVFNGEGPPVPIPNTEVKLTSADNTCLETDWKDRSTPTQRVWRKSSPLNFASLAQQVEHAAVNRRVVGSSPTGGATATVLPSRYRGGNIFQMNYGPLAQLVEQPAHNRSARGSSP